MLVDPLASIMLSWSLVLAIWRANGKSQTRSLYLVFWLRVYLLMLHL
jgi:hypothetical protein